jgi:hypothetical protein
MLPPSSPPPDVDSYLTWCDPQNVDARGEQLDGPCLRGMPWWAWVLLIGGCMVCNAGCCYFIYQQSRAGMSPSRLLSFLEAVLAAQHADASKSRMAGRAARHSRPIYDLVEARNCCCCLPLAMGLCLLGLIDLGRLTFNIIYSIESTTLYASASEQARSRSL